MCGLVAAVINSATTHDINIVRRLMEESSVRGLHATGISWCSDEKVNTEIQPVPFNKFNFAWERLVDNGSIAMVGHCRYSTSDLEYNQPISDEQVSIVHNGVISQDAYYTWHQKYGIDVGTNKNDSALIWNLEKVLTNGAKKHPLEHFPDSSMAVCKLTSSGGVSFYRNGKRPLHYYHNDRMTLVASTKDIFKRSVWGLDPNDVDPGVVYKTRVEAQSNEFIQLSQRQIVIGIEDLQDDGIETDY